MKVFGKIRFYSVYVRCLCFKWFMFMLINAVVYKTKNKITIATLVSLT